MMEFCVRLEIVLRVSCLCSIAVFFSFQFGHWKDELNAVQLRDRTSVDLIPVLNVRKMCSKSTQR